MNKNWKTPTAKQIAGQKAKLMNTLDRLLDELRKSDDAGYVHLTLWSCVNDLQKRLTKAKEWNHP